MTPERFAECRNIIGWQRKPLARRLKRAEGTLRQWEEGRVQIPETVADWLERLARFHERNPPPAKE